MKNKQNSLKKVKQRLLVVSMFVFSIQFFFPSSGVYAQNCVDSSLIDPGMACMDLYDPVCGCNNVTYSNSCYAVIFGGVTEFTMGACSDTEPELADSCADLTSIDFGDCDMFLGYGLIDGACAPISGCGWIVNGMDYSAAIYQELSACKSCLTEEPIDADACTDLFGIDFGVCAMFLGIGIVNDTCVSISGCSMVVNGVNYEASFYPSLDLCKACLGTSGNDSEALEGYNIYPNPADQFVTIESGGSEFYQLKIFNAAGQLVFFRADLNGVLTLSVKDWDYGVYWGQLVGSKHVASVKIVVAH